MTALSKKMLNKPQWLILTLLVVAAFCRLALWQLDRADEKRIIQASLSQQGRLPFSEAGQEPWIPVMLQGHYLEHTVLLDNQLANGVAGYEVLTPLQIQNGDIVVVNRGWVALKGDVLPVAAQQFTLHGVTAPHRAAGMRMGPVQVATREDGLKVVNYPTFSDWSEWLGKPVLDITVWLDADQPYGFRREWKPQPMAAEKHLAYAVQWFALAITVFIVYLVLTIRRKA